MPSSVSGPDEFARALAAVEHGAQIEEARSTAWANIGFNWACDLASVVRQAMREVVILGQHERAQAAGAPPHVAARLRVVGDAAAVCMVEVVRATAQAMCSDPPNGREV